MNPKTNDIADRIKRLNENLTNQKRHLLMLEHALAPQAMAMAHGILQMIRKTEAELDALEGERTRLENGNA